MQCLACPQLDLHRNPHSCSRALQDCVYLAVTASEYPQRTVFKFLEEVPAPLPPQPPSAFPSLLLLHRPLLFDHPFLQVKKGFAEFHDSLPGDARALLSLLIRLPHLQNRLHIFHLNFTIPMASRCLHATRARCSYPTMRLIHRRHRQLLDQSHQKDSYCPLRKVITRSSMFPIGFPLTRAFSPSPVTHCAASPLPFFEQRLSLLTLCALRYDNLEQMDKVAGVQGSGVAVAVDAVVRFHCSLVIPCVTFASGAGSM
jgi:hypothetical protein